VIPRTDGLLVQTMFFESEVKELPAYKKVTLPKEELLMAKQLVKALARPFKPGEYKDEYQKKLRAMIQDKIGGREVVAPKEKKATVIDMMDALKKSLADAKKGA
ncbi:MAG: Ku protein, partial [Oscillospiraceae bacterium]|nr:Ku protein [Oscillospiraceae bacterium]